jgi:hypothetical protein
MVWVFIPNERTIKPNYELMEKSFFGWFLGREGVTDNA